MRLFVGLEISLNKTAVCVMDDNGKAVVPVARELAIVMHKMWFTGEPLRFGVADAGPRTP